jgi:hypothetical protein
MHIAICLFIIKINKETVKAMNINQIILVGQWHIASAIDI